MSSEIGDLFVTLRAITEPFTHSMRAAAVEGEASGSRIGGAFKKLAGIGMGVGAGAAAVIAVSVKMAADFESVTTRLVTSAGETKDKLDMVRQGLLQMSGQVGVSATDLAKAMYYVEAAGFHAADGLVVLKAAAQGAAAEGADTTTVAQALTDVLKDYHMQASASADVTSKMIMAVAHGKVSLQDFSASFANIVPAASAAGISFNDVGAALSTMTNHGFTAQRASMNLAQALRSLLNPTKPMAGAFKQFGVSADELKAKLHGPNGLTDAMQYLSQAATKAGKEGTPEYAAALKRLMGTAAGANAALTTTGQNIGDTNATIKAMAGASADAQGKVSGFALVQKTFNQQLKQTEAGFGSLAIKLGMILLPYVEKFLGWVQVGVNWLMAHKSAVMVLAGALGTALVAAIVAVGGALAAALGPEELIAAGIMAVGAALVWAYGHFTAFRTVVNDVARFLGGVFAAAWKAAGVIIHWFAADVMPLVRSAIKAVFDWFTSHKAVFQAAWNDVLKAVHVIVKWFDDKVLSWIRARIADLTAWWSAHSQELSAVWSKVWSFIGSYAKAVWNVVLHPMLVLLMATWRLVWGILWDTIKIVWSAISGVVTTAMHLVMNVIGLILDVITGKWGRVWGDLKKLVSQAFHDIVSTIGNLVSGFGTLLWDAGVNIIKGLISGIESMIGGVTSTISSVAHTIRSFLPFSPAKRGPLSGSGSPDLAGAKIGDMLATGMANSTRKVSRAGSLLAGAAALAVGGAGGSYGALALGAGAGGGAGGRTTVYNITVQGSVIRETDLFNTVQRQTLRYGRRNPTTGVTY